MGFKHLKKRDYSKSTPIDWDKVKKEYNTIVDEETQELGEIAKHLKRIADALEKGK